MFDNYRKKLIAKYTDREDILLSLYAIQFKNNSHSLWSISKIWFMTTIFLLVFFAKVSIDKQINVALQILMPYFVTIVILLITLTVFTIVRSYLYEIKYSVVVAIQQKRRNKENKQ